MDSESTIMCGLCKRHMNGPISHIVAICHAFLVHIYSDMGKRKIRFDVWKNFERKKVLRGFTVSIPLDLVIVHHGNRSAANGERQPQESYSSTKFCIHFYLYARCSLVESFIDT